MEKYLEEMGIVHHYNTPLWPRANGEVERQNRSLLKAMRVFQAEGTDWRLELNKFLLVYRSTSHTTTGVSLAELFFKRKLTTKLPESTDGGESQMGVALQRVRDRDSEKKKQAKQYADTKYHAKDRAITVGDAVLFEVKRENKLSPLYESQLYEVTARYGDQFVLKSLQGVEYKRNLQHIKRVVTEPVTDAECSTESGSDTAEPVPSPGLTDQSTQETTSTGVAGAGTPRRSGRISQPPKALADYVLY